MKELNLNSYINDIPHKNITINNNSTAILNKLKGELIESFNFALKNKNFTRELTKKSYIKGKLFTSIPVEIQQLIENEERKKFLNTETFKWNEGVNHNITFNVIYANNIASQFKYILPKKLIEYYLLTRTIFHFLIPHSCHTNGERNINIFLYLTRHLKVVPTNKKNTIQWININTGLTTFCNKNTEINIFRVEEWFKVLIHESIHNLCMDFSSVNNSLYHDKLKDIFIVNSDYLLFETYTELWAEIIQILFLCILNPRNKLANKITNEFIFSVVQSNKTFSICTQKKATYNDLVNRNNSALKLYKEGSNCFAYNIFKMIGLYNINDFLSWCDTNNKTDLMLFDKKIHNIVRFIRFFEEKYTDPNLIQYINIVDQYFKQNTQNKFINESLRISIHEVII